MPELFDTTPVSDNRAHWDALAERVAANAAREARTGGFEWLAQSRAGWVAASLLSGGALLSLLSSNVQTSAAKGAVAEWARVLAPADDVGKAITVSDSPPAIGALLLQIRGGA